MIKKGLMGLGTLILLYGTIEYISGFTGAFNVLQQIYYAVEACFTALFSIACFVLSGLIKDE